MTWHPSRSGGAVPGPRALEQGPRPRGTAWALAAVGLVLVAAAAIWVTQSPIFRLRTMTVQGNRHLSEEQIARLARINDETNVFWLSTGSLEALLESNPWISSASVGRSLPTSLNITVTERRPIALLYSTRGLLVASDGTILDTPESNVPLPVIQARISSVSIGSRLPSSPALTVVGALPNGLRSKVHDVVTADDGLVELHLRNGARVLYGDGSQPALKARAVLAVMGWASRNGVRVAMIDVRSPAAPAIKPAAPK